MADHQIPNVKQEVAVVVVPFPAQGHLNPLLHLSRRISACNIPVYYVGATTHIRQATARLEGCDPPTTANLHFHDFSTPPFPNLSPDHSADSSTKFPSHMLPMIMAILSRFRDPLHELLAKLLSSGRVVVIFDALMATVVNDVHQKLPRIECYSFIVSSAFYVYSLFWEAARLPADAAGIMKELPSMEGCYSFEFQEFLDAQRKARNFHSGSIYNSSRIIEGAYLDSLAQTRMLGPGEHWGLGPMSAVYEKEKQTDSSRCSSKSKNCMDWLDKQPPNSVIFVSFGTTSSISEEQIRELALGLERSEQRFIWSLRDADKGDIFQGENRRAELPLGFEERVRERGVVVREWAPQLEILEHRATGGFLSHCGWNSSVESISLGVPIAAWPMHSDQPRNALLITKVLKIGVEVRDWERRDELVGSVAVEQAVRRLMASVEGEAMRRSAAELAESLKQSMVEGGAGRLEMDSFVDHIARVHIDSTIYTDQ